MEGPLAKECRYLPDLGHGDVIEVGDSHAAMWFPAVEKMAEADGWGLRFWGRNSCPLADVTKNIGTPYVACDKWRADVMNRLVAAKPSLVIVASLDSNLSAVYQRDRTGKPTTLIGGRAARALYQNGMAKNLAVLQNAGIRTLVIHDTPGYPHAMSGPDCVLKHPRNLDACSLAQGQAMPGAPNDLGAAAQVNAATGQGHGTVSTIDFTPVFCRRGRCYQVVGSTLAYRDFNHLTSEMVMRLEPDLAQVAARATTQTITQVVPGTT